MNLYKKISSRIEDLILAVVSLGILVVSIEYVQYFLGHQGSIDLAFFAQRIFLFISVVTFTSYYFISYTAYFNTKQIEEDFKPFSPRKTIVLYLNDLTQVTVSSWLYAALLIGNLTSASSGSSTESIKITVSLMQTIFMIMLIWHLVVLVWYFMSGSENRSKILHSIYLFIYVAIVFMITIIPSDLFNEFTYVWCLLISYFGVVLSLYYFKGIYDMEKAIDSHKVN
jgi:hypothetical protein